MLGGIKLLPSCTCKFDRTLTFPPKVGKLRWGGRQPLWYTNYILITYVILFWEVFLPPAFLKVLDSTLPLSAENFHLEVMEAGLLGEAFVPETCFKTKLGGRRMDSCFLCFLQQHTHIQWYRYLIRVLQRIISHMVSNDIKGFIYSKWCNSCFHQQYFSLSWLSSAFSGKMNL